ncbi:MAG: hypothetical protein A2201_00130 [Alicyclobacillus sp. RIFOXYA1_FULL_53_8]|nr:MAG: hypothetical protein A2201_00130 [Alicyclobacillus sp. RIFOXYA1_FULL_53_8]
MPKILLLTASFGDGHKQVARALQEQFLHRQVETVVLDGFRGSNPHLAKFNEWIYESTTRYLPFAYGLSYRLTQSLTPTHWLWRVLGWMSSRAILEAVEQLKPDAVVQLFPDHSLEHIAVSPSGPVLSVVLTDYSIHSRWFHPNVDVYFLPHPSLERPARVFTESRAKTMAAGIPVRDSIRLSGITQETSSGSEASSGPQRRLPYCLISTGGRGVFSGLRQAISAVRRHFPDRSIYVMCGRNTKMQQAVHKLAEEVPRLHALPFVENMGEWLRDADFAVMKSGGVTVTECLVSGCPVVVFAPQAGQEADNAAFLERIGAGYVAREIRELDDVLERLAADNVRAAMSATALQNARPAAAERVVEYILQQVSERSERQVD